MGVFYATLLIVGSFFALMSVRLIFLNKGEFKGTCANQSPFLKQEGATCGYCGKDVGSCENEDNQEENEVNKVLSQF